MEENNTNHPRRPIQHVTGDRAYDVFSVRLPKEWIKNPVSKDYGWDVLVTRVVNSQVQEDFFVQLKGSNDPEYIEDGKYISQRLKIRTINWLLSKSMPTMLCICDTGNVDEPIFYTWLQDEMIKVNEKIPNWKTQKDLSIHIPTTQILDNSSHKNIDEYIKKFHEDLKISAAIGNVFGASFGFEKSKPLSSYVNVKNRVVLERISPFIADLEIFEVSEEADDTIIRSLSKEGLELFKEIKKSSYLLNDFRDYEAEKILKGIVQKVENSSNTFKARFINNKGVLELHRRNYKEASKHFNQAIALDPDNEKYAINALNTELMLAAFDCENGIIKLNEKWIKKLNEILSSPKSSPNAKMLKATWIGITKGAAEAEKFLKDENLWEKEPVRSRCEVAELHKDQGNWDKALSALSEVDNVSGIYGGIYWNLYGSTHLQKAFGNKSRKPEFIIIGPGPSQLDIHELREAEKCFIKSCNEFFSLGFPFISESAIVNLTVVQRVLGKNEEAKHFCKSFLLQHPENIEVSAAMAGIMMFEDEKSDAVKLSRMVYRARPDHTTSFRNYLICLHLSEESEEIIELVINRQKEGFKSHEEEALSLSLYTIALNEIGQFDNAAQQLAIMKQSPYMLEDAVIAESIIIRRNGASKDEVIEIYRKTLKEYPESPLLLTHLMGYLDPNINDDAQELIQVTKEVAKFRQLLPSEIYNLGLCYLQRKEYDDALLVFKEGLRRYPTEIRFIYEQAITYFYLGDQENTYKTFKEYISFGKRDHNVLKNLGISALETGRLKEAIQLFQQALNKSQNKREKAELNYQLWQLKIRARAKPKEIMRHIIQFGSLISDDPSEEAQFLMMALLSPYVEDKDTDEETKKWSGEIKDRLKAFSESHPNFEAFRTFNIPKDITDEEKGQHILYQIAALTLPHRLAVSPFELSSRNLPYPLAFRSLILRGSNSIFLFWTECTSSTFYSLGVHIWYDQNPFNEELDAASKRSQVCVDLTVLLTLAELDILDILCERFELIILSLGTKKSIEYELFQPFGSHPLADKIEKWRILNRSKIRIRGTEKESGILEDDHDSYSLTEGGLYVRAEWSLERVFTDGTGESILLAKKLGIPLYSDDSAIREVASKTYNIECFSTIALFNVLRNEGQLRARQEAQYLCEMIRKNFRIVRFNQDHLNSCLTEILSRHKKGECTTTPSRDDFLNDYDMGTLLRQFSDTFFNEAWLADILSNWWRSLLEDEYLNHELLVECMDYPCFALSMRTTSGVIKGVQKFEQENRLAHILGYLLLRTYEINNRPISLAWSAIKTCCERIFPRDENKYNRTLFIFLPKWIINELQKMMITDEDRINRVITITSAIPNEDRSKIDRRIFELKPSFMKLF